VTPPSTLARTGRVYLVPLGPLPDGMLDDLVTYHRERFGVRLETLPSVAFTPDVFDPARRQVIAEEVVALMRRQNSELATDPDVILIGVTTHDMYIREYRWRFAFAYRADWRAAVVSAARMSRDVSGEPDPDRLAGRLRKMVTRQIGILHFRLPPSSDPGSVMFGAIGGVDDLDRLGEEF
jgi:predicted Zn-dependent protease